MASTTFTTRALTAAVFTLLAWAANPTIAEAQLIENICFVDVLSYDIVGPEICGNEVSDDWIASFAVGPDQVRWGQSECEIRCYPKSKWISTEGVDSLYLRTVQHRDYDVSRIFDKNNELLWSWSGESIPAITWYTRDHVLGISNQDSIRLEFSSSPIHTGFCIGYLEITSFVCEPADCPCVLDLHQGCTYNFACNYNPDAVIDNGSCTFPAPNYDCAGNCLLDLNNNGLCDLEEVAGCTNIDAINYNAEATLDDGSCITTCKGDFNNDGEITSSDLLSFLAAFGNQCAGAGCMDPAGCNYDPNATFDLGYCEYPAEFFNCDGTCANDADGDGICDELEVPGCTDPEAGNYNPEATDDDGSCASAKP